MTLFNAAPVENRSIVATVFSLEAGRLTNGQKAGLPVYSDRLHNDALQISLWPPNPTATILVSEPLGGRWVTPCDEGAVAHTALGLTVQKRLS